MNIVKTYRGWRIYGHFGAVMDVANDGTVIYCNMNEDSVEYKRLLNMVRVK